MKTPQKSGSQKKRAERRAEPDIPADTVSRTAGATKSGAFHAPSLAPIIEFDRQASREFVDAMKTALAPMLESAEVEWVTFKAKYADSSLDLRIEFKTKGGESHREAEFKRYAGLIGFQSNDLHKRFTASGYVFEIIGVQMRSRKKQLLVKCLGEGMTPKPGEWKKVPRSGAEYRVNAQWALKYLRGKE